MDPVTGMSMSMSMSMSKSKPNTKIKIEGFKGIFLYAIGVLFHVEWCNGQL